MADLLFNCTTGTWPTSGSGTPCDFNSAEACDATDIDLLATAVRNGTSDSRDSTSTVMTDREGDELVVV